MKISTKIVRDFIQIQNFVQSSEKYKSEFIHFVKHDLGYEPQVIPITLQDAIDQRACVGASGNLCRCFIGPPAAAAAEQKQPKKRARQPHTNTGDDKSKTNTKSVPLSHNQRLPRPSIHHDITAKKKVM